MRPKENHMKRRYRGGMIVGVGVGIAALTILAFTPASAAAGAAIHALVAAVAPTATPTPDPVVVAPTVAPTSIPQVGGGVDTTPGPPSRAIDAGMVPTHDANGNVTMTCPLQSANDPYCGPAPITGGCRADQTTLTNPAACQDPPVMGCPGAIHYPNGFTSLPPCVRPTPTPAATVAPTVAPTPVPIPTPAPTPAPSATP